MAHKHAALMALYAQDASETDEPWKRWESCVLGQWTALAQNPHWYPDREYRRKPKTIMVNGFEVPAPLDKVQVGTTVYIASPASLDLSVMVVYTSGHNPYFDRKIVHATRDAAVAHAKAMLGIDPGEA